MKMFSRVFIFLLAFQIEVRVKASAPPVESQKPPVAESSLVQNPEHCWENKEKNCQIKALRKPFHLNTAQLELHISSSSVMEKISARQWKFIEGTAWIEKANKISFETLYGATRSTHGEYWLISQGERILIKNISSDVEVTLRDGRSVKPPAGFQMWIAGINSKAQSEYGMIEPIDLKKHLLSWYPLYPGSREEFAKLAGDLRHNWGSIVDTSSAIYKEITLRKIASIDAEKNAVLARQRRAEEERRRIRELFRSRTFDR